MMADMLAFLLTRPEQKAGVNEIGRHLAELGHTPLCGYPKLERSRPRPMDMRMLHPKTLTTLLRTAIEQKLIKSDRPIGEAKRLRKELGKKNWIRLTRRGAKHLTEHKIRSFWGFAGFKWAEDLWKKGYEIQFLANLTGIEAHKNFLFAWHPKSKDIRILQSLNPREYKKESFIGFRVTRDPTTALGQRLEESNPIENFVLKEAGDELSEENVGKALRKFFDYPTQHNLFVAHLVTSETVHFGMPMLANFELISLVGVGFQEVPLVDGLRYECVALELPVSQSVVGELHLKIDVGKVNRWTLDAITNPDSRPESDSIAFVGPELVCRHNEGKGNRSGKCRLGFVAKCEFARTLSAYIEPPCDQVKEEMQKLLGWSIESTFNV
jgi:hypothetical protein